LAFFAINHLFLQLSVASVAFPGFVSLKDIHEFDGFTFLAKLVEHEFARRVEQGVDFIVD
jgi:hypothetical protein